MCDTDTLCACAAIIAALIGVAVQIDWSLVL